MRMLKLTLDDGEVKELTEEEAIAIDLMGLCNGKAIIKVEFFQEDGR